MYDNTYQIEFSYLLKNKYTNRYEDVKNQY